MFRRFRFARSAKPRCTQPARSGLRVEQLEAREMPATLLPISDYTTPNTKAFYAPLSVTNVTGTVSYNATSSNSQVSVQVVPGGTTIKMHVTGKDSTNTNFEGDLTFRLFDSLAPTTTARIVSLVNSGFYNGLKFHRIIDGFMAQGGDPNGNGTGGSGTKLSDEFNSLLTFNSPGLLAMANSGDDTSDSQFFVTDIDLTLAQEPQNLNFNYTIFGQLVAGFDTFSKLMSTQTTGSEGSTPVNPVTITSATVVQNDPNGILRVTAPANFTGTTTITVTPSDGGSSSTGDSFTVTFAADTQNDAPFLGTIANQTTTVGTGVTFQVSATDLENDPLTYSVTATANGSSVNVNPKIDNTTGRITVTPPAGFVGTINLTIGVKDASNPQDTQVITLTVSGGIDLEAASDTGVLDNDNITGASTPALLFLAPAGQTVTVTVNGTAAGTATATGTSGQYRLVLPAGLLKVGANTIAATAGSTTLTPLTITYAPSLRNTYTVAGTGSQQLTFTYSSAESAVKGEFGYFRVDDASGKIGTLLPGQAGYFAAAMARRNVVFSRDTAVGTTKNVTATGGDILVMYLIQNGTSNQIMKSNPTNSTTGGINAFFSLVGANSDGIAHVSAADDAAASKAIYGFEDGSGGGDKDYNDMVVSVRKTSDTAPVTLQVPAAAARAVTMTATLRAANKAEPSTSSPTTTAGGEVGYFLVDDATGKIGNLTPGQAGYAAAALQQAQVLFASSAAVNATQSRILTGGQFIAFYYIKGGTAAQVLASNSTNNLSGSVVAYFSIPTANADGKIHARNFDPERITRTAPTSSDPLTYHMMAKANGGNADFDDVVFNIQFAS